MKIKKIHLENFKSYKNETINFEEGINCILGKNGAGKSSIIEAIGYAMFNFLNSANKSKLIRYGESKAIIELEYIANDGIDYKIVRTISKNDKVKLINLSTQEAWEDVSNVYDKISKTIGLNKDRSLSNLFEEIIAVPQGEFVSIFLLRDSERIKKFDDLFNLKIYQKLFVDILDVINTNKEKYNEFEKEIIRLKAETNDLEELKNNLEKTQKSINGYNEEISKLSDKNRQLEKAINDQEKLKENLDKLQKEINELNVKITKEKTKIEGLEKEEAEIKKAKKIIDETTDEFNKYNEINSKIVEEEKVEKIYQEESDKLNELKIKKSENVESIKSKEKSINEIEFRLKNIDSKIKKINDEKSRVEEEISKAKYQEKIDNEKIQSQQKNIDDLINKTNECQETYLKYKLEYNTVEKYASLDYENETKIREDLITKTKEKTNLNLKLEDIKNSIIKQRTVIENINKNMESLSNGICPILSNKCMNISTNGNKDLLTYLALENDKLNDLTLEETELKNQLKDYENIENEIHKNDQNILDINSYKNQVELIKNEILNDKIFEIDLSENINLLFKKMDEIKCNKNDELTIENNNQISNQNSLNEVQKEITKLLSNQMIYERELSEELINKDNEIKLKNSNKSELETLYNYKETLDKELEESLKIINKLSKDVTQLEIDRIAINNYKNKYELYIQNINKSNMLENNQNDLNISKKQLDDFEKSYKDFNNKINDIYKDYNEEKYSNNNKELASNITLIESNIKQINLLSDELKNQEKKVKEKELSLLKINELNCKFNKHKNIEKFLNNARNILRNLPIELSRQYRENISKLATIYYQRISKENVTIEIDETYKVFVIDNIIKENKKEIAQLSGGEQMSLAISIRISMLKYFAGIDIYFLDEPTVNLDKDRRYEIADVIKDFSVDLKQLFVISHDDTFETITTNILKLEKTNNESEIDLK